MTAERPVLHLDQIAAVVFHTNGVLVDTARVHAAAWKRSLDELLQRRRRETGEVLEPFDIQADYLRYVHGHTRLDAARTFLASRGITLPDSDGAPAGGTRDHAPALPRAGETRPRAGQAPPRAGQALPRAGQNGNGSDDDPYELLDADTLQALIARKTHYFLEEIDRYGVPAFPTTLALIRDLRSRGARHAAVSASQQCARILRAARVHRLFDVRVDGLDAAALALRVKPDPALFLEAARRLAVPPKRAAVIEDSPTGIEAARRGGFGVVIGVDRRGEPRDLHHHGAHIVVRDLAELGVAGRCVTT